MENKRTVTLTEALAKRYRELAEAQGVEMSDLVNFYLARALEWPRSRPAIVEGRGQREGSRADPRLDWWREARFGMFIHWGLYAVPAFGNEWYPRNMHLKNSREYRHHLETYGDPSEFGYHDFVPMFKAEYFDAGQWADVMDWMVAKGLLDHALPYADSITSDYLP